LKQNLNILSNLNNDSNSPEIINNTIGVLSPLLKQNFEEEGFIKYQSKNLVREFLAQGSFVTLLNLLLTESYFVLGKTETHMEIFPDPEFFLALTVGCVIISKSKVILNYVYIPMTNLLYIIDKDI
jgi:hypothetical protein